MNVNTHEVDLCEVLRRLNATGAHGKDSIAMVKALFGRPGLRLWCTEFEARHALSEVFLPEAVEYVLHGLSCDTHRTERDLATQLLGHESTVLEKLKKPRGKNDNRPPRKAPKS